MFVDHSLGMKIIVYFLFLQNNIVGIDFFPVSWSLVIEEWFYLLIPLGLLIFSYGKLSMNRLLFFICGLIIFENLFRLGWILYTDRPFSGIIGNFPFRLDSLVIGVLLAYIKINKSTIYMQMKKARFFLFGLIVFFSLLYLFGNANLKELKNELIWTRTFWFSLFSFSISLMIPFLESIKRPHKFIAIFIERISLYTYSIYIIHYSILIWIIDTKRYTSEWLFQLLLAYLIIFTGAALLFHFFEKPMMDLRDKIKVWKIH